MHTHVSKLDLRRKTLITQPPPPEKEWSDGFGHEMEPLPPEIAHKETKLLSAITFLGGRGFDLAAAAAAAAAAATWKGGSGRGRTERDGRRRRMGVEAGGTSPAILPSPSPKTKPRQIVPISTRPCNRDDAHADSLRHMK